MVTPIISRIIRFEPPLDRPAAEMLSTKIGLSVVLEDERQVRLNPDDKRSAGFAQILDELRKQNMFVYVEVDSETSVITTLLIPDVTRVIGIYPIDDGTLGVELERSHGRHVLRRDAPNFEELEKQLREALQSGNPVILTENDAHEIIDVRVYIPGPDKLLPPLPKPGPVPPPPWPWNWIKKLLDLLRWLCWPILRWLCCISSAKAQQVFDAMNATSCDPLTVPVPCIPFLYPNDGCWGRAHEMCRLMINMGLKPKKVWIQGSLHVQTKNSPNCNVYWGWHVAPTLCVRGPGIFQTKNMVIDPSLFSTPVTKATWKGVQGDPNATLTDSAASIFYLWGNVTDPTYTQTNHVLATYRLKLKNRAIQYGPPPYANC